MTRANRPAAPGSYIREQDPRYCEGFRALIAVVAGGTLAVGGAVVGGLIGWSVRRETWVGVPIPAELGLMPTRDGGLGVRLTLRM